MEPFWAAETPHDRAPFVRRNMPAMTASPSTVVPFRISGVESVMCLPMGWG